MREGQCPEHTGKTIETLHFLQRASNREIAITATSLLQI